jgi:hypothetical protein
MRKMVVIGLFALALAGVVFAQPAIEWQKSLGGSYDDFASSIQQTTDGGFIVAGCSSSNDGDVSGNHGSLDFWVVKLYSVGEIVWQKSLGGDSSDIACSIQQTTDGGYIVGGYSCSNDGDVSGHHGTPGDSADYWVVKLNSEGNIYWQKCLGGSSSEFAVSIDQTTDGGFIVAGNSWSNDGDVSGHHGSTDYLDFWVVKLNSSGDISWQKSLGGSRDDWANSIEQTVDGGFIVAGCSSSNDGDVSGHHGSIDYYDYWVVKLNSEGNIEWQKSLGGSASEYAYSIEQTTDGGFIVAGYSFSNNGDVSGHHGSIDYYDYWVVKLNSEGNIEWQKSLGGSASEYAYSIEQTTDGGYIVAGSSSSNNGDVSGNHGYSDYWVVKLNSEGIIEWQKSLGGSNDDGAYSIDQTADGGYIVTGYSESNDGDVSGHHCTYSYGDYWVVKLGADGITENKTIPEQFVINVSPNPFNSTCKITVDFGRGLINQTPTVEIFDLGGKCICSLRQAQGTASGNLSNRPLIWSPDENVTSGVYLVRVTTSDGQRAVKRVVLMR